jgi:hypothetical protein
MRLVRQGGSSNPKGGADRKKKVGTESQWPQRTRAPPIEETRFKAYPEENVD